MGHNVTNTYNVYKQPMAIEKANAGGHNSSLHYIVSYTMAMSALPDINAQA